MEISSANVVTVLDRNPDRFVSFSVITTILSAAVLNEPKQAASGASNQHIAVKKLSRRQEPDLEALRIPSTGLGAPTFVTPKGTYSTTPSTVRIPSDSTVTTETTITTTTEVKKVSSKSNIAEEAGAEMVRSHQTVR
ncbi:unnamed protein product [Toxocara canis]|uniref:Flocculation protein FLO11-like n=1 Tax=Toxocara canis TaxID=6265 RepID=A0A183TWQ6_TOXCA|nr:unnamed protein product [Toxocara canis]